MPNTTALLLASDDNATIFCPADNTTPVRSSTFLESKSISYSMYSPFVGEAKSAIAKLTLVEAAPLLHIDIVATAVSYTHLTLPTILLV